MLSFLPSSEWRSSNESNCLWSNSILQHLRKMCPKKHLVFTCILFSRFLKIHKHFLKLRVRIPKLYQVFITFRDHAHSVTFFQFKAPQKFDIFQQKSWFLSNRKYSLQEKKINIMQISLFTHYSTRNAKFKIGFNQNFRTEVN